VFIKLNQQTLGCSKVRGALWRIGNPSSSAHEVQKTMQRSVTNGKTADHGRSAMTAAQMLLEKPVGMA
jgi:predicted oxidoreductase